METKEKETIRENVRLKGRRMITAICLLALCMMWGCDSQDAPLSGDETGKGKARVLFTIGGIGYDDDGSLTKSGGAEEKQTVLVPLGDGENLLECTLEQEKETARTRSTDMATGTKVLVFIFDESGNYVKSGVIYSGGEDESGAPDEGIELDAGKSYKVRALSFNSTTDVPSGYSPASLSSPITVSPSRDLLFSSDDTGELNAGDNTVTLHFTHVFSKVMVVADASYYSQDITACSATLMPGGGSATLVLDNGVFSSQQDEAKSILWTNLGAQVVTSEPAVVNINGQSNLTLNFTSITLGSSTYNNKSVIFNKSIDPGYSYTLKVNFKNIPWVTVNGVTWAKANLYKTATAQGLFSKEYEYGNSMADGGYWNWGATQPWSDYLSYYNVGTGAIVGTNAANWSEPNYVNDPCRLILGGTWRLPKESEFDNIITPNTPNNTVWGTYSSSGPGSTVFGRWFGTIDLPYAQKHPAEFFFLPAAKGRLEDAMTLSVASRGFYWVGPATPNNVYYLSFANINGDVVNGNFGNFGRSIRCVRDVN